MTGAHTPVPVNSIMALGRRAVRCSLALVLLVTIVCFLLYPNILIGTPLVVFFTDMEVSVVIVLFAGMFFLLFLLLYLGGR